ncbi:MAG: 16S rRNA (cytidine(1402)-2'-O)-methyltransferase [Alphaproteobacteria bacterium]|nr:16S rRNA (cytidine(1402)-2'-O)-methyltransferase [Alphaproteobacteria bacterium]
MIPRGSQQIPARTRSEIRARPESTQGAEPVPGAEPRSEQLFSRSFIRQDPDLEAGLYIVSTPIGNLRDITLRALDVLSSVRFICAEDTRVAARLLGAYGISTPVRSYHDHNGAQIRPQIVAELRAGASVALISDAGTPLVSDPGFKLVREAARDGIRVTSIPGASAVLAGLAVSGLPSDRFTFVGFPPARSAARRRFFLDLAAIPSTLIFFEGPSRLVESLEDMAQVLGNREAAVAREISKVFEETRRGTLCDLAAHYSHIGPPRGELVIVVAPPHSDQAAEPSQDELDAAILSSGFDRKLGEIASEIATRLGLPRRTVYDRILLLRKQTTSENR